MTITTSQILFLEKLCSIEWTLTKLKRFYNQTLTKRQLAVRKKEFTFYQMHLSYLVDIRKEIYQSCHGQRIRLYRIFVNHAYDEIWNQVGWVSEFGITCCMICDGNLGRSWKSWRQYNHCYACGNIVCKQCVMGTKLLKYTEDECGIICKLCDFGQVSIH